MDLFFDNEFRALIPTLAPDERQGLEQSLISEGNRDPIVIWKETKLLLDGHNRYDICTQHGIKLQTPVELSFPDREAAKVWIINNQLSRRNIPPYVRAVLALKLEDIYKAQAEARMKAGKALDPTPTLAEGGKGETRNHVASKARLSHGTITKVKAIEAKATPEQKAKLAQGTATINQVFTQIHRNEVKEKVKEAQWPTGKYRVFYADPPWQYDNKTPQGSTQPEDYYTTMPVIKICELPVADLAMDDAVLFLWTTSPMLEEAFKVVSAWGFKYKASFVWDKVKHNMGNYNSVRHEFLLIAVRGSCQPESSKLHDSVQVIERKEHSTKPDEFRQIIDTLYPHGPRIELFATKTVPGWEAYGNQINYHNIQIAGTSFAEAMTV